MSAEAENNPLLWVPLVEYRWREGEAEPAVQIDRDLVDRNFAPHDIVTVTRTIGARSVSKNVKNEALEEELAPDGLAPGLVSVGLCGAMGDRYDFTIAAMYRSTFTVRGEVKTMLRLLRPSRSTDRWPEPDEYEVLLRDKTTGISIQTAYAKTLEEAKSQCAVLVAMQDWQVSSQYLAALAVAVHHVLVQFEHFADYMVRNGWTPPSEQKKEEKENV